MSLHCRRISLAQFNVEDGSARLHATLNNKERNYGDFLARAMKVITLRLWLVQ
jgi:hypothetical protein